MVKELYGIRVGSAYFVGIGTAGFGLGDNCKLKNLTLENARVRILKDPYVGTHDRIYVLDKKHLMTVLNYAPNNDIIPLIIFNKKGIDKLVSFPL
jgi:hypothetical protein